MDLHILGTRGVPAQHGGFETFAEQLAMFMVSKGHSVTVYCQNGPNEADFADIWKGINRVGFSASYGALGTISFDLRSAIAASRNQDSVVLTLGYNTAIFSFIHHVRGVQHFMNMDGIEWKRQKWNYPARLWLRANEWIGARISTAVVADHPEIKRHLTMHGRPRKAVVIPYGADSVESSNDSLLDSFNLQRRKYFILIARPEPENSILEIIKAFSSQSRSSSLLVLGHYRPNENSYHKKVLEAAFGANINFAGGIYDTSVVSALRSNALAYVHGHQVGGTNPSLVEALAASSAIIAHDNLFNRWVAGPGAFYFTNTEELSGQFSLLESTSSVADEMRKSSTHRHRALFRRELILEAYETLLNGNLKCHTLWCQEGYTRPKLGGIS